jgi:creatinine amidohydrolase
VSVADRVSAKEYELLTAPALERLIEKAARTAIVPFGSIEHQGGHLPLGADALLADLVGRALAARLPAVLLPTVRVGCAEQHVGLPGTLSISADTVSEMAVAIATSLAAHGFRLIAFVGVHGGNAEALRRAVESVNHGESGARACVVRGDVGPQPGTHSGRWLTSVLLAFRPELVDLAAAAPELRDELKGADAHRGRDYFEAFVSSIVDELRALI